MVRKIKYEKYIKYEFDEPSTCGQCRFYYQEYEQVDHGCNVQLGFCKLGYIPMDLIEQIHAVPCEKYKGCKLYEDYGIKGTEAI
jgi:hypothetical protein